MQRAKKDERVEESGFILIKENIIHFSREIYHVLEMGKRFSLFCVHIFTRLNVKRQVLSKMLSKTKARLKDMRCLELTWQDCLVDGL